MGQSIYSVVARFNTEKKCIKHLERIRWPNGLECPRCKEKRIMTFDAKGKTGKARHLYNAWIAGISIPLPLEQSFMMPICRWSNGSLPST